MCFYSILDLEAANLSIIVFRSTLFFKNGKKVAEVEEIKGERKRLFNRLKDGFLKPLTHSIFLPLLGEKYLNYDEK